MHWVDHARIENVSSKVQNGMKRLFDPSKGHLSIWVWIHDPEPASWAKVFGGRFHHPGAIRATPLHYAATCGMHDIARFLIVERSQDINARGLDMDETPLHVAVRWGHVKVSRVLLELGADTEVRDRYNRTPLLYASKFEHVECAQVLLEHGADPEALDDCSNNNCIIS